MAANRGQVVFVTAGTEQSAVAIARSLVAERLAACVNLVPVRSIYRWKEEIEDESEYLLIIKTQRARFRAVERRVRELHSYEIPEVISIPIAAGSVPYLSWLLHSTSSKPACERDKTSRTKRGKSRR